ncbi:MAG TPA: hypothetical protein PLT31_06280 [Fibrobacteraceae bacterium]|jgi:hypothetical protein|nr:hypothetical protein [Fibrobacter sp.]HPW94781.1 hypothetical protein [Fibrobacteraceae bacterium]HQB64637.1 hypothetical protein [Fibrobacteraceae bacterium]
MNGAEIISIAILWCICLLALIQALNARGAIRISLTWIITMVIVIVTVAVTYIQLSDKETNPISSVSFSNTEEINTPSATNVKQNEVRVNTYISSSKKLVAEVTEAIRSIEDFDANKVPSTEAEREVWERQALSLSQQTAKLNQRTLGLFHPRNVSELHGILLQCTENLRLAGYALHTLSTLEDPELKEVQKEQYLNQIAQAKQKLNLFQIQLKELDQP